MNQLASRLSAHLSKGLRSCLFALLLAPPYALALDGAIPLGEYHHDIWTAKDGAPGEIASMAQTADGWLWIGSASGLYRFDGVRFIRFEAPAGEEPLKRTITALNAQRNGDLLVGYISGGLDRVREGRVTHYPDKVGEVTVGAVYSAEVDADGVLWAATTTGLLQLRQGQWHKVGAAMGLPAGKLSNLMLDQYGQLWIASADTLWVLARGSKRFRAVLTGVATVNLSQSPDGRLWLGTQDKLIPVPAQHQGPVQARPGWMSFNRDQESGLFDRDGNYWQLACPVGLCRSSGIGSRPSEQLSLDARPEDRLDQPWQMSSLTANLLFEDRDGNMWVGTQSGVERFRHNRLRPVKFQGGERFYSVARDGEGKVWAHTHPYGRVWRLLPGGVAQPQDELKSFPGGMVASAPDGAWLLATAEGIERRRAGQVERIAYPPGASKLAMGGTVTRMADTGRALWISIASLGTFRLQDGEWTDSAKLGIPQGNFFLAPGAKGGIWFGYRDGLLLHADQGRLTRYGKEQGVDLGPITFIHDGPELLVGGDNGLAVYDGHRFRRLNAVETEAIASVSGMVIDDNGDRWLNGSQGALHVKAADWNAALANPDNALKYTLAGVLDGYLGSASAIVRRPSAISSKQGDTWFIGSNGVTWLDRSKLAGAQRAPRVTIDSLAAPGRRYSEWTAPLLLNPGVSTFRIEYTALSYARPELVRFRYRLEGVDEQWVDAGNRRAVSYSNLGPGDYRFAVAAVDGDGQWNDGEATIALRILPTFTQTPLYYGLCLLALAGLAYGLHRLRLKQLTARLDARLAERERIARALHDTFLQGVQSLILNFHAAALSLPQDCATRQRMEHVLLLADRVMAEGRDEVQDLRSLAVRGNDIGEALYAVAQSLKETHPAQFTLSTSGQARPLEAAACEEIYHIAREALMNAFRHAEAGQISVELDYGARRFTLRLTDNGKGIPDEILLGGQRAGHWGMPGMAERAGRIHGRFSIESKVGQGTQVQLCVPARLAYGRAPLFALGRAWRSFRAR